MSRPPAALIRNWPGLAVLLVAMLLRFLHLDWGLPDCYEEAISLQKAWGFWNWGEEGFDFNPHFFNYPTLYFYMQFGVQLFLRTFGIVSGSMPDADAFRVAYEMKPEVFILAGRTLSALLGSATVYLLYLAARSVGGDRIAIPASLFLAFHTVHLEKSRFLEVDVPATFFGMASLYFLVRFLKGSRRLDLIGAGAAVGLAASIKYPALLLLVNLPVAVWLLGRPFRLLPLLAGCAAAVAFFLLGSPYILLDPAAFLRDFGFESYHMRVGHSGSVGGGLAGALTIFSGGFGVALFAAGVAGTILAIMGFEKKYLLFVPAPLLYFTLLSASRMQAPHYPLPALPSIALLAAFALTHLFGKTVAGKGRWLVPCMVILVLVRPGWKSVNQIRRLGEGDSRTAAREWVEANVREGALILLEPHGPQLQSMALIRAYEEDRSYRPIREALMQSIDRPAYHTATLPIYSVEMHRSERYYHQEIYHWFDLFIISSDIKERYRSDRETYGIQNEFYDDLEEKSRLVRRVHPEKGTGPTIEIYQRKREGPTVPRFTLDRAGARSEPYLNFIRAVAAAYEETGKTVPAMALYRALLELQPDDAKTLAQVGTLVGEREGVEAGLRLLRRSVELDPTDSTSRMNLAVLLCQGGRLTEGIPLLEDLLEEDPDNADLHGNLGSAFVSIGRPHRAIDHFNRFLELAPGHPSASEIRHLLGQLGG